MSCGTTGEELPAPYYDIHVTRIKLEAQARTAVHFGGDHARPRAEKRVIDRLARPAVVDDRTAHALHRLLGTVPPALLALTVAERIVAGDLPGCRLGTVALPVAGLALAHRVPTSFVLPVVIAAAQHKMLLDPDDLSAQLQPAG